MFKKNVIAFVSLLSERSTHYDRGLLKSKLAELSRQAPQFQLNLLQQSAG
jgi:hypothetical protein